MTDVARLSPLPFALALLLLCCAPNGWCLDGGSSGALAVGVHAVGARVGRAPRLIDAVSDGQPNLGATSYWQDDGVLANAWFTLDLGGPETVGELLIAPRGDRKYDISMRIGSVLAGNRVTGGVVASCTLGGGGALVPNGVRVCAFPPATGRYVTVQSVNRAGFRVYHAGVGGPQVQRPYSGTPVLLPGRVEVEDYDLGGAGVAWSDTTTGNAGGTYRNDGVDIYFSPGLNATYVGAIATGEWLEYTVDVVTGGTYALTVRYATGGENRRIRLLSEGVQLGPEIALPTTGGLQVWRDRIVEVTLPAGLQTLRLAVVRGGLNIDWFSLTSSGGGTDTVMATLGESPAALDLTLEGATDWIHWALDGNADALNRKQGVVQRIRPHTVLGGSVGLNWASVPVISWTDGTPRAVASGAIDTLLVAGSSGAVRIRAATAAHRQQLDLYLQVRLARVRIDVQGSGLAPFVVEHRNAEAHLRLSVAFQSVAPHDDLVIDLTVEDHFGLNSAGVGITAATLRDAPALDALSGLASRPVNATCFIPDRPAAEGSLTLEAVYPNVALSEAVALLQEPGNASYWYAVERTGAIRRFSALENQTSATSLYLDHSQVVEQRRDGGLLSIAFHPQFPTDGRVFLSYVKDSPAGPVSVISSIRSHDGNQTLDPATEEELLTVLKKTRGHNGGHIAFGPDGYLYFGLGDDGPDSNDPDHHGQNTATLQGSVLRIDVDGATPYSIPADNPFASGGGAPEIYAWGLRNPWRWSFDPSDGRLWLADVGEAQREEVNIIENGGNYGWRCWEGTRLNTSVDTSDCGPPSEYRFPIAELDHVESRSVTGGHVYRGSAIPQLQGVYLVGDFVTGSIWGIFPLGQGTYDRRLLANTSLNIAHFAADASGEVYVLGYMGEILKVVPNTVVGTDGPAELLSATGCVDPADPAHPAAGLVPYDIVVPFWSDGAVKSRAMALPDGAGLARDADDVVFPAGTVLVKHFRVGSQPVETRLLVRHADGGWGGYSYEWNPAGTDATLVPALGKDLDLGGQVWRYPSRGECFQCHTAASRFVLGVELRQLNRALQYPARSANQLDTWQHIGLFDQPLLAAERNAALPDPNDVSQPIETRARSYLHTNCAQCHQPGGGTLSTMDLRFTTPLSASSLCDAPKFEDFGYPEARIIAPGAPGRSVALRRISEQDGYRMPPVGSNLPDPSGVTLITNWINQLGSCP